jgi:Molybdate transporter of MFS superfamily
MAQAAVNWLNEISGSFGDMGTLLPILVSLSASGQISLSASLIFGGIFNIISGFYFKIPMCVQPMKSIAAIALLANLSPQEIASAGISVSIFLLFFAFTGLIKVFNNYIPLYIIRGIQLGTGLTLISKGVQSVVASNGWIFSNQGWKDNNLIAMVSFLLVLFTWRAKWNFSALLLFFGGLASAFSKTTMKFSLGPQMPTPFLPSVSDLWIGFTKAGLGQLPLSLSNSVIAVAG